MDSSKSISERACLTKLGQWKKSNTCVTSELRCSLASVWYTDILKVSYILPKKSKHKTNTTDSWSDWTSHILDFDLSWHITNFKMVISTFCDRYQWSVMREESWWVSFRHSHATVQTTLSSVTLRLSNKRGCLISHYM